MELSNTGVYFEHHILLWKDPAVMVALHPMKGAFKRMLAGMPFLLTGASGPGRIAFSRDGAGHVFGLHLKPGESVDVREHQWLAATDNVEYTFTRVRGAANMLLGGTGFFIDTFSCPAREGILWLHGFGNVFEVTLAAGEQIDIEPGGWIYKERTVQMQTMFQKLSTGFFASARTNRLEPVHRTGKDCAANDVLSHGRRRIEKPPRSGCAPTRWKCKTATVISARCCLSPPTPCFWKAKCWAK
jgi:uncharacterized protein (AIM24 family)